MVERIAVQARRDDVHGDILTIDVITGYVEQFFPVEMSRLAPDPAAHWSQVVWMADMGKAGLVEALRQLADYIDKEAP